VPINPASSRNYKPPAFSRWSLTRRLRANFVKMAHGLNPTKSIGKQCARELYTRFDESRDNPYSLFYL